MRMVILNQSPISSAGSEQSYPKEPITDVVTIKLLCILSVARMFASTNTFQTQTFLCQTFFLLVLSHKSSRVMGKYV